MAAVKGKKEGQQKKKRFVLSFANLASLAGRQRVLRQRGIFNRLLVLFYNVLIVLNLFHVYCYIYYFVFCIIVVVIIIIITLIITFM